MKIAIFGAGTNGLLFSKGMSGTGRVINAFLDQSSKLSELNEVAGYRHSGFWHCLDTMRDKEDLNILWKTKPLWKRW